MTTPEVAQQLALIAPWLKAKEPFILVSFGLVVVYRDEER